MAAAKSTQQTDIATHEYMQDSEAWNENVEKTVDLLWDQLVTHLSVSVSQLLIFIDLEEVDRVTRRLHHLENTEGKPEEAAAELLRAIKRSDEPGRWRMLVNALKEVSGEESIFLHYLLNGESTDPWLDNPEHRKLINLMKEHWYRNLRIELLMPKMIEKSLISPDHERKILAKLAMGDTVRGFAQLELIAAMQSHKVNWYRKFVTILYEDDYHRELAEKLDPEFCEEKLAGKMKETEATQEEEVCSSSGGPDHHERQSTSASSSRVNENDHHEQGFLTSPEEQPQTSSVPLKQAAQSTHHGEMGTPPDLYAETEATCGCKCCAQLAPEVTFLRSTVLSLHSELKEIKQLLMERAQKDGQ